MKLTRVERWMLSNQYRILEGLYPHEAEELQETRDAIEHGYELHYDENIFNICDDSFVMTKADCIEISEIFAMFKALQECYAALPDKVGIEDWSVQLIGFDANSEFKELGYASYLCKIKGGMYAKLKDKVVDSHVAVLDRYRAMLNVWKGMNEQLTLTKEQIIEIASPNR